MNADAYDGLDEDEETEDEEFNPHACLMKAAKKGNERAKDILGSKMARDILEKVSHVMHF
jgi:hypothetical protein